MDAISQDKAIDTKALAEGDRARFFRVARHDALDCLAASFRQHAYAPHTHDTYVVGAIMAGCETYRLNGVRQHAPAGSVCFVHPGEVHDGEPAGEGYAYRMSYPSLGMLTEVGEELCGKRGTPRFRLAVTSDPDLAARFGAAHHALELSGQALMADERMLGVLAEMMRRYADIVIKPAGTREPNGVARAMTYLDANYAEDIDLARLSTVAGLPRFRLIRAFRRETGLTPHAFLVDRRVRAARDMLAEGASPVDAAARSGFYDQAHLTRAFKARVGVTPGVYRSLAA